MISNIVQRCLILISILFSVSCGNPEIETSKETDQAAQEVKSPKTNDAQGAESAIEARNSETASQEVEVSQNPVPSTGENTDDETHVTTENTKTNGDDNITIPDAEPEPTPEPTPDVESEPTPEPEPEPTPEPEPVPDPPVDVPKDVKPEETGSVDSDEDAWIAPANANNMKNPEQADSESLVVGKTLYRKHCASCHGKTGHGDGPKAEELDTPTGDFTDASFRKQSDGSLFYKTMEGREDMPSFKKKLPDQEDIWHIVNYVRALK